MSCLFGDKLSELSAKSNVPNRNPINNFSSTIPCTDSIYDKKKKKLLIIQKNLNINENRLSACDRYMKNINLCKSKCKKHKHKVNTLDISPTRKRIKNKKRHSKKANTIDDIAHYKSNNQIFEPHGDGINIFADKKNDIKLNNCGNIYVNYYVQLQSEQHSISPNNDNINTLLPDKIHELFVPNK